MTTVLLLLLGIVFYVLLLMGFIRFFQLIHELDVSIHGMTVHKRHRTHIHRRKSKRALGAARA